VDSAGNTFALIIKAAFLCFTVNTNRGTSAAFAVAHGITGSFLKAFTAGLVGMMCIGTTDSDITF
jgi:uncharacterized membrane protein